MNLFAISRFECTSELQKSIGDMMHDATAKVCDRFSLQNHSTKWEQHRKPKKSAKFEKKDRESIDILRLLF